MRIAIMQPYIFPYIGYFQLINSIDKFVIYDDVNFIKQGWINRNNILVQNKPLLYTIPLKEQSSFLKINEICVNVNVYNTWLNKFLKTLKLSYKKAPFFDIAINLIKEVLVLVPDEAVSISSLATKSLILTCDYLELKKEFVLTSSDYGNSEISGKERVVDICKKEKSSHYINPIGGQSLYTKDYFIEHGLKLNFIKPDISIIYKQFNDEFIPWLSIIDVLMFNSKDEITHMLSKYELT